MHEETKQHKMMKNKFVSQSMAKLLYRTVPHLVYLDAVSTLVRLLGLVQPLPEWFLNTAYSLLDEF